MQFITSLACQCIWQKKKYIDLVEWVDIIEFVIDVQPTHSHRRLAKWDADAYPGAITAHVKRMKNRTKKKALSICAWPVNLNWCFASSSNIWPITFSMCTWQVIAYLSTYQWRWFSCRKTENHCNVRPLALRSMLGMVTCAKTKEVNKLTHVNVADWRLSNGLALRVIP